MTLTEEQKERMQKSRERALEIQRRRSKLGEASRKGGSNLSSTTNGASKEPETKRLKTETDEAVSQEKSKVSSNKADEEDSVELEDFEVNASPFVTKKEAMQTYCLPEGTLAVCSFEEKANPRHKGWTPMKLYKRSEIRRRARERFGGLEGLVAERNRRAEKRFKKDLEATKDIFK